MTVKQFLAAVGKSFYRVALAVAFVAAFAALLKFV